MKTAISFEEFLWTSIFQILNDKNVIAQRRVSKDNNFKGNFYFRDKKEPNIFFI